MTFRDAWARLVDRRRLKKAGVVGGVTLGHALVLALILLTQPRSSPEPPAPPIEVQLVRPELPEPPPPPRPASREAGGGAPAAPSRVHVPPLPEDPPEPVLVAPPEPAPEPTPVIGAAPIESPRPGLGQGGEGTGTGSGVGGGSGPGSGAGRAVLVRGPTEADIRRAQPRTGLMVRRVGRAEMSCRIRLDGRMEACRVTRELPPGSRLGQAALSLAPHYLWRPPTDAQGRPVAGTEIVVGVDFPP